MATFGGPGASRSVAVLVFVISPQAGRGQHQLAVLDPPQPDDLVGILAELCRLTLQDLNLQTKPLIEVHVQSGQNAGVVRMARLGQVFGELPLFMVEEQRQARHCLPGLALDPVLDQASPDEVANSLRSIAEPAAFEELVEVFE